MSHIQTEQAQNDTSMGWAHMQPTSNNKPHSFSERAGIGSLGLSLRPNRRPRGVARDEPRQMQSPTVPNNLFTGDSPPPTAGPLPSLEQTLSTLAATLEGPKRGSYTLNRAFMRAWEENNPPVPQLPKVAGGSFPTRIKAPVELPISFPRPDEEPKVSQSSTAAAVAAMDAPPSQSLPPPPPAAIDTAGERTVARKHSVRQQATLYPKRNYSLPAALAPPPPRLKLESYDFTSIESLERKWADAKTETTRMLSSAIYKYYFSHGEWQEFEQVFPAKVLESWEEFRSKLTQAELGFINTVLVSQNPFSSEQRGERETHIPVLARTIPLAQVVRTMVLSEDMRSRESYSSQNSNGPEIDSEFADWLITRFNAKRPGTATSPIEPAAAEPKEQKPEEPGKQDQSSGADTQTEQKQQQQPQSQEAESAAEQKSSQPSQPESKPSSEAQPVSKQGEENMPEPKQNKETRPENKQLPVPKTELTQPTSNRKSLGLWSSEQRPKTAICFNANEADAPKPRRKNTISGRSSDKPPSIKSTRRPTLTSMFQGWRKGSSKSEVAQIKESLNLPAPATEQRPATAARPSSRSRRHTHNFFSSSSSLNDPARASLDMSRPSSRRITQDIQMKDLPPLPANAAELSRGLRMEEGGVKMSQSASVLRKGSAALTHFSSHTDLMSQRMAAFRDKPRTSSLATSESSSQMRDSGSSEFVPMTYDWRPVPAHGDCSWGFTISPLALQRPLARKKSAALVVSSHTPTMNRRNQSPPKPTARARADAPLNASRSLPETQTMRSSPPPEPSDKLTPPELPKAKMPQSQLGLGISQPQGSKGNVAAGTAALSGVRAVLYELAYLSTQSKSVWSKSDHIFANMSKTGLEVNRIAEQDFFDFCVDELLKSSYEASQDLQAMGNKKVAKKLYESFNAKLAILLADSAL
ncbi:hypothetical protein EV183_005002 [Coemansia sp. RSA 2336]|nr:hypothetical protein EV183_005002 [Coemansia sp. RSA 2336]